MQSLAAAGYGCSGARRYSTEQMMKLCFCFSNQSQPSEPTEEENILVASLPVPMTWPPPCM